MASGCTRERKIEREWETVWKREHELRVVCAWNQVVIVVAAAVVDTVQRQQQQNYAHTYKLTAPAATHTHTHTHREKDTVSVFVTSLRQNKQHERLETQLHLQPEKWEEFSTRGNFHARNWLNISDDNHSPKKLIKETGKFNQKKGF